MRFTQSLLTSVLLTAFAGGVLTLRAADKEKDQAKPYPLDKCIVCDDKLGDKGKPQVFTYEGQEIKLCCKDCLKHFKKKPSKYLKKIEEGSKAKDELLTTTVKLSASAAGQMAPDEAGPIPPQRFEHN